MRNNYIILAIAIIVLVFYFVNRGAKTAVEQKATPEKTAVAAQDVYRFYLAMYSTGDMLALAEGHFIENPIEVRKSDFKKQKDIIVTADDGYKAVIKQAGTDYVVLCSRQKHIVLFFPINPAKSKKPAKYDFSLTKIEEYQNVTAYNFVAEYTYGDTPRKISRVVWFGKGDDKYCGGIDCYTTSLKTAGDDKEFYAYIKDAYIGITEYEMAELEKSLDAYKRVDRLNVGRYIYYISGHDKKIGAELKSKYSALIDRHEKYRKDGAFIEDADSIKHPTHQPTAKQSKK